MRFKTATRTCKNLAIWLTLRRMKTHSISFEIRKSLIASSSIPLLITLLQEICLRVNSVKRHTAVVVVVVWPTCHKEQKNLAQTSSVAGGVGVLDEQIKETIQGWHYYLSIISLLCRILPMFVGLECGD